MIYKAGNQYLSSYINTDHGFNTKRVGDGRNIEVIKNLSKKQIIAIPKQTHSINISIIDTSLNDDSIQYIPECDGLITRSKNIMLTVVTADCVPIVYYDDKLKTIGISHQGWKGTLGNLPGKMIDLMVSVGSSRENIQCAMGPAINACCYRIDGKRLQQFQNVYGEFTSLYQTNIKNLLQSGIHNKHIDIFPFCTSCNVSEFYSYRRDHGIKGEIASFITL